MDARPRRPLDPVTKVLCGHAETLQALTSLGVTSFGDSRLENLAEIRRIAPEAERWLVRLPGVSVAREVVALAHASLVSEFAVMQALSAEARRQDTEHGVIIMIELGDLREGILPGRLIEFYNQVFELTNIRVLGIGANFGCLAGALPSVDHFMQLILYRELLELKFGHKLPYISAGATVALPLVLDHQLPRTVNHFRIGEAVFLGTDLVHGGALPHLRDDAIVVEAEVLEIQQKSLVSTVETGVHTPFAPLAPGDTPPGGRGYRALVGVGQLDTEIAGLTPLQPDYRIVGATSDITVVSIGENPRRLAVGDAIRFRPSYAALVRLMAGKYLARTLDPSLDQFLATGGMGPGQFADPVMPQERLRRQAREAAPPRD